MDIHQKYFLTFCRDAESNDDPNVVGILLEGDTLNVLCINDKPETYLPKEFEGYKIIFTIID